MRNVKGSPKVPNPNPTIAEIEERLSKATPWENVPDGHGGMTVYPRGRRDNYAEFIAHAPEDIAQLIELVEKWKESFEMNESSRLDMRDRAEKAEAALEKYGGHTARCADSRIARKHFPAPLVCTCGWDALNSETPEKEDETKNIKP